MTNLVQSAETQIKTMVEGAFAAAMEKGPSPGASCLRRGDPRRSKPRDFAVNAAMVSRRPSAAPQNWKQWLGTSPSKAPILKAVRSPAPGFINFFLGKGWFADAVAGVLADGDSYGTFRLRQGEGDGGVCLRQPYRPHAHGNARAAPSATAWPPLWILHMRSAGNSMSTTQATRSPSLANPWKPGTSSFTKGRTRWSPEDGYHGDDIKERAKEYADPRRQPAGSSSEERQQALIDYALPRNVDKLKSDLENTTSIMMCGFKESTLHASGAVQAAVDLLASKGLTYEKDGAIWYKATEFGGEKDEVLVRANGFPHHFAADIAYHYNKFAVRGFDRVITFGELTTTAMWPALS